MVSFLSGHPRVMFAIIIIYMYFGVILSGSFGIVQVVKNPLSADRVKACLDVVCLL